MFLNALVLFTSHATVPIKNSNSLNMELESDPVPYETPLQSNQNSFQDSSEHPQQQNDQVADSTQPSLHIHNDNAPPLRSAEEDTPTDHHGNQMLRDKLSTSDAENSSEENRVELDKNRIDQQDDDVISFYSHHPSSDEVAPVNHGAGEELSAKGTVGSDRQTDPVEREVEREVDAQSESRNEAVDDDTNKLQENDNVGVEETEKETVSRSKTSLGSEEIHTAEAYLNIHEETDKSETERTEENKISNSEQQEGLSEIEDLSKEGVSEELSSRTEGEGQIVSEGGELRGGGEWEEPGEAEEDEDMMTFEEFKQKKIEEGNRQHKTKRTYPLCSR